MGEQKFSEWLWRFLAVAMLFSLGWTVWLFYQLNPAPLVTRAAYEAAASAKAKAGRNAQGVIVPAPGAEPPAPVAVQAPPAGAPTEAPINPDKLKFSESLSNTAPESDPKAAAGK